MKRQVLIFDDVGVVIALLLRGRKPFIVRHIDCFAKDEKHLKRAITFLCDIVPKNIDVILLRKSIERFCNEYSLGYSIVDYIPKSKNWTRELKNIQDNINNISSGGDFKKTSLREVRKKKMC